MGLVAAILVVIGLMLQCAGRQKPKEHPDPGKYYELEGELCFEKDSLFKEFTNKENCTGG